MKRILSVLVALLVVGSMGIARAESEEGRGEATGPEISVGLKTWMNSLKRQLPESGNISSNHIILVGPAVEAEFENHLFVEGSYLRSASDYKVSEAGEESKFSRSDIDLAAGYQFNHAVGAFVGYRDSALDLTDARETSFGPLAGVRGSASLGKGVSLFGKATYLLNRMKTQGVTEKAPGWIVAAGANYEFTKQLAASLGYQVERTKTRDSDVKDTFSGATLDVSYAF